MDGDITSFCSCKDIEWHGCYGSGAKYNKYTIPESVKHPAKMSWELLERIFKHLESMNMLTPDSVVIDFMAGSGRTGTIAALRRYRTISVELEPHFIEMIAGYDCDGKSISDFRVEPCVCKSDTLHKPHQIKTGLFEVECSGNPRIVPVCRCGNKIHHKRHHIPGNRELMEQATGRKVKWDVIQGDARELTKLLEESGLVGVVSPPYFSQVAFQDKEFIKSIAEDKSQRYRDGRLKGHYGSPEANRRYAEKIMENYSLDARNIGNLPDAPLTGIISPPYGECHIGDNQRYLSGQKTEEENRLIARSNENRNRYDYSKNPNNIGNLPDRPLTGIISPPYQNILVAKNSHSINKEKQWVTYKNQGGGLSYEAFCKQQERHSVEYSSNPDNIANLKDIPLVGIMSPPYQDMAMPMGCPANIRKLAREGDWDKAIELERKSEAEQVKKGNKFAVSTDETIRKKIEMALEREKGNYSENLNNIGNLPDVPLVGIMSPPYVEQNQRDIDKEGYGSQLTGGLKRNIPQTKTYSQNSANIGNLKDVPLVGIMSPPYSEAQQGGGIAIRGYRGAHMHEQGKNQPDKVGQRCGYMKEVHGSDPAQIGNLPDKPLAGITSPPYVIDNKNVCHTKEGKTLVEYDIKRGYPPTAHQTTDYSTNSENIGNLPDKPLAGITSPPYEGGGHHKGMLDSWGGADTPVSNNNRLNHGYGSTEGQIEDAPSYLSAMLKVYQQAFLCGISPLVVVTKNPTRNGKLRRLDLDTIFLLQKSGYEIFDYHRAILFESHKQGTLDGESKDVHKGRISFFKRLSLGKGTTVAQWEDVIFARIPMRAPDSGIARAHNTPGAPNTLDVFNTSGMSGQEG